MRTTLDIDDELLKSAKKTAAARGIPLRRVVEEGLALVLARPKSSPAAKRLRWKTTRGAAFPGVDFADRDRLYEAMEGRG
jgi:hypothetical protein